VGVLVAAPPKKKRGNANAGRACQLASTLAISIAINWTSVMSQRRAAVVRIGESASRAACKSTRGALSAKLNR